ncbi:MAG: hypothetical protein J6A03_08320 [Lachnospiraceae bacterium]|nr:hypothetical protein [Lachnospiraceae bacterium]
MFELAAIFKDGMVLQQHKRNVVWGTAEPGVVKLNFRGQIYVTAVTDGKWKIELNETTAGGSYTMELTWQSADGKEKQTKRIQDILVGEVWLAGGQSNMELALRDSEDGIAVAAEAAYQDIRFYNVPKHAVADDTLRQMELESGWQQAVGEPTGEMSAVAFYYAVKLYETLRVPIGIIDCYWGGTSATCWVDKQALQNVEEVQSYLQGWQDVYDSKTEEAYAEEMRQYQEDYDAWNARVEKLRQEDPDIKWEEINERAGLCPWPQPRGRKSPFRPFGLHETMVNRVKPYGIKGFIYYQGEEDWERSEYYHKLNSAVIRKWRSDFGEQLPFYLVQLPMYRAKNDPDDKNWCILRRQQEIAVEENDNMGIAVILDCGEFDNIHPDDKKTPGTRLALQALGKTYQVLEDYEPMRLEHASIEKEHEIWLNFTDTYGAICYRKSDGRQLTAQNEKEQYPVKESECSDIYGLEVSEDGTCFYPATIRAVEPNRMRVSGRGILTAVRYGWTNYGVANLYNAAGIPLAPFMTEV